ncbi:hypothetical protein FGB62_118g019 [Gracilaria domingensis]|nr:hypothetical protein FGB62_118g019 [Gracilaria domingensis]
MLRTRLPANLMPLVKLQWTASPARDRAAAKSAGCVRIRLSDATLDNSVKQREACGVGESEQQVCSHAVRTKLRRTAYKQYMFFVDGKSRGTVEYQFVRDLDVFPTLSLFFKHALVYARFNGQDMLFASSLPVGEEILTLDGQKIRWDAGNTPRSMGLNTNG